jgi:hypothetical protein
MFMIISGACMGLARYFILPSFGGVIIRFLVGRPAVGGDKRQPLTHSLTLSRKSALPQQREPESVRVRVRGPYGR